ncbi:MAG: GDP-mannose 4,6-dehydratase, partial [Nanoarchaeota archaeon]
MKLLVTGGAGFIGSNFIIYILKKYPDYEIINLDKLTYAGNLANLKDVESDKRYKFVLGDICDKELVDLLVKEVDAVVHFAAESHVDRSILNSDEFVKTNVLGTQVFLDAALRNGNKRFHHISTDEVFGSLG